METACHSQLAVPIVADTQILNKYKKSENETDVACIWLATPICPGEIII